MYDAQPDRRPKHSHYVSLANGCIAAALTNLPGYEDDNPTDWRPATADEIARYKDEGKEPASRAGADVVALDAPVAQAAAPTSITLADDEPATPGALPSGIPSIPAPATEPNDPPSLPAGAIPAPAPAFGFGPQQ